LLAALSGAGPAPAPAPPLGAALDRAARELVSGTPLASASVAVVQGGRAILVQAYGEANLEHGVKATVDTRYFAGSIAKEFVAAAIEQLAETGRIELSAPANRYLPEMTGPGGRATIAQLLSHTAGLVDYWAFGERSRRVLGGARGPADVRELFWNEPLLFAPGARRAYSNSNYLVLEEVLERVSGAGFEAHLRAHLLPAAGLTELAICDDRLVQHRAAGYLRSGERWKNALPWAGPALLFDWLCPTASELAAWQRALAAGKVVPPGAYLRMTTPVVTADGRSNDYGQGLMLEALDGHASVGHGGNGAGFAASVAHFPKEELTVAVLVSGGSSALLADTLARLALGLPLPPRKDLPLSAGARARFVGRYALPRGTMVILEAGGRLRMHAEGVSPEDAVGLEYQGGGEFLRHGSTDRLRIDEAGVLHAGADEGRRLPPR
jgi:CubicO group peptidase (beta-lactamase class C family)